MKKPYVFNISTTTEEEDNYPKYIFLLKRGLWKMSL